jgi:hypothetical protein
MKDYASRSPDPGRRLDGGDPLLAAENRSVGNRCRRISARCVTLRLLTADFTVEPLCSRKLDDGAWQANSIHKAWPWKNSHFVTAWASYAPNAPARSEQR